MAELLKQRLPELKEVAVRAAPFDRPPMKLGEIGLTAKSVIAVGSGKGGVGKSTIAACIALGLARSGSMRASGGEAGTDDRSCGRAEAMLAPHSAAAVSANR